MLYEANKVIDEKALWEKCTDMLYNYKVPLPHKWLQSELRKWHENRRQSAVISKGYSTERIDAFFSMVDVWLRMKSDSTASALSTSHGRSTQHGKATRALSNFQRAQGNAERLCWTHTFCITCMHFRKVLLWRLHPWIKRISLMPTLGSNNY